LDIKTTSEFTTLYISYIICERIEKKAIIVLDDAGRVIRVDINASKFTLNYTVYIK